MVVTTGGFQSCSPLTSGISKVRRYPRTEPEPAASSSAPRAIKRMFLGFRQKGTLGGAPAGGSGGGPVGGTAEAPPGPAAFGGGAGTARFSVVKGPLATGRAAY